MADVPVPEVAIVSARSSARITRPRSSRASSSRSTKSGSRWPSTGAAMARITRGEIRLGPGPNRIRSVDGSDNGMVQCLELHADDVHHGGRRRAERRARRAAVEAHEIEGGLQAGHAVGAAYGSGDGRQTILQLAGLIQLPCENAVPHADEILGEQ